MHFRLETSPHLSSVSSISQVMGQVMLALIPGTILAFYFFGWGVLFNLVIAGIVALSSEALMLRLRQRPVKPYLLDGSALTTAWLLALALPPLAPWWLTAIASGFAIIIAKQLYGGLGFNPFNPAMVGYVVVLISFPADMTHWLAPETINHLPLGFTDTAMLVFAGVLPEPQSWDALTTATPLDQIKTELGLDLTVSQIRSESQNLFGLLSGRGWEWINGAFLLGGLWLMYKKVIQWQIPVGVIGGLFVISGLFYLVDPTQYSSPLFHIFSGGLMLCAFFIATDPVSAATTPRGRLIFGAGIGLLIYIIRTWGGYPDGIAFAVLLMNMTAPMLDYYTQPRVFGHRKVKP